MFYVLRKLHIAIFHIFINFNLIYFYICWIDFKFFQPKSLANSSNRFSSAQVRSCFTFKAFLICHLVPAWLSVIFSWSHTYWITNPIFLLSIASRSDKRKALTPCPSSFSIHKRNSAPQNLLAKSFFIAFKACFLFLRFLSCFTFKAFLSRSLASSGNYRMDSGMTHEPLNL